MRLRYSAWAQLVTSTWTASGTSSAMFVGLSTPVVATLTVTSTSTASFVGAGIVGLFAMTGSGSFVPVPLPAFAMRGSGSFDARGETVGTFKPEWAINSNRVIGPPSPETT